MDNFNKREEGFERVFAAQEELQFRARAQRNRLLGAWAAGLQGLAGPAIDEFAAAFAARHVTDAGDNAAVAELVEALAGQGVAEARIRRRIDEFGQEALAKLQARP